MNPLKTAFAFFALAAAAFGQPEIRPTPRQLGWQELEFGVAIRYAAGSFPEADADPEQWVLASRSAGARYVILSPHRDFRDGKRNLIAETASACRKHGLKFGISVWGGEEAARELTAKYPDLTLILFDQKDPGNDPSLSLRAIQPNLLLAGPLPAAPWADIRVTQSPGPAENWYALETGGISRWRPAVQSVEMTPANDLVNLWHQSVGRGYHLLLTIQPGDRGVIPTADVRRLEELGEVTRRLYSDGITSRAVKTSFEGGPNNRLAFDDDPHTVWFGYPDKRVTCFSLSFAEPMVFDRMMLMEWLGDGQRIQRYRLQSRLNGTWHTVVEGTSVGHKRIETFPITTAVEVRIELMTAAGPPAIREFQLFNGGGNHHVQFTQR